MNEEIKKEIKIKIEKILDLLSVGFDEVVIDNDFFGQTRFIVKTKESNILIGNKGEIFLALNHIIKRFTTKILEDDVKFSVDINDYQENNTKNVINKAKILAERVRFFKTNFEMEPMSPYERMIVHTLFSEDSNIKTESEGQHKTRRVVLKYITSENKN